jgi:hypothetical protein
MALTTAGTALTRANQAAQLAQRAQSLQGLLRLWSLVDVENLPGTIDAFAQAAALLAGEGFDKSAAAAANYYGLFRRVEGIGTMVVPRASRPAAEYLAGQLRGAALKGIIDGRKAGMSLGDAKSNGFVRVAGALVKLVLGGGRMTIITAADTDRQALGWSRVTSGDPCAFCRMLASRGPVYKSEKSADFEAHDHDACMPEPLYRGDPVKLGAAEQSATYLDEYRTAQEWARSSGTMSAGTSNNALNNYRRWLDNGSPSPSQGANDGAAGAGNDGGNPGVN